MTSDNNVARRAIGTIYGSLFYLLSPFSFSPKFLQVSPGKSRLSFWRTGIWASETSERTGISGAKRPSWLRWFNPGNVDRETLRLVVEKKSWLES